MQSGLRVFNRLGLGALGFLSVLSGTVALSITAATPASAAAATYTCSTPASGGTAVTFYDGVANSESIVCYGVSGVSGTTAYPASITLNTGSLPPGAVEPTSTTSTPVCTTSTSGSGTTEHYLMTCPITDTPTAAQNGSYPVTFTANPGTDGGTATNSGTLTVTVAATTQTCIDPASGGTSTTFYTGSPDSYTVECEIESHVSGQSQYPSSIAITSGALPADANQAFATSTASSPACTTGTSGSGATEEYILECNLTATPTAADVGSYPFTFTSTGPPGTTLSGTLTVNVAAPPATTTTCSAPAAAGTATTFTNGTAGSYTVICYSQGFVSSSPGNYPASIALASGTLPADVSEATSLSSSPACTTATTGSSVTEEYELECAITQTPTGADDGSHPVTFLATGGTNGAPNVTSGTWTLTDAAAAPTWTAGQYFSAIKGVAFCDDIAVSNAAALPLTSITAGATPSGIANYGVQNVNLAAGTAQICGTDNNTPLTTGTPPAMAPVATNGGGSATDSITIDSQNECTWTAGGASGTAVSMFDPKQDLEQAGSQSAFGAPISNGEVDGTSTNYPTCPGDVIDANTGSGDLGGAFTINTANPLPSPTDTNPSAAQGDLASSNLELAKGCYGATEILKTYAYSTIGSAGILTVPSPWVNGGTCSYGGIGSNSAGGNTDTVNGTCPPSQADVNEGYVGCSITASSGNDDNGSTNFSTMDIFFNGQPVPQQSTATLSTGATLAGGTVSVTGGANWWGSSGGAPNTGPYGDTQAGAMYPVTAPGVFIGTSRGTAVPVTNSTVTIGGNTYVCTGAESSTVGPNPCIMTPGQPSGTFQVPAGLSPGTYNVYIDETDTTPLPGNGPNDAYQTALGTNLGTAESVTSLVVGGPVFTSAASHDLRREHRRDLQRHRDRQLRHHVQRNRRPAHGRHPLVPTAPWPARPPPGPRAATRSPSRRPTPAPIRRPSPSP